MTKAVSHTSWLEERRRYICATDITRLLGLAPAGWGGPYRVWLDKTTPVEDNDELLGDLGYWGHRLEPMIAERYAEVSDDDDVHVGRFADDYVTPWPAWGFDHCAATPDYYIHSNQSVDKRHPSEYALLECKNVSAWATGWGPSGSPADGNVPAHYVAQVRWQLGCVDARGGSLHTGMPAVIAALIGGNDWRWYTVEPDEDWFLESAELADRWYADHVEADNPPPPDQRSDIVVGAPCRGGLILTADDELESVLDARAASKNLLKVELKHVRRLDTVLIDAMGADFDQINRRDGTVAVTYRAGKDGTRRLVAKV